MIGISGEKLFSRSGFKGIILLPELKGLDSTRDSDKTGNVSDVEQFSGEWFSEEERVKKKVCGINSIGGPETCPIRLWCKCKKRKL